MSHKNNLDIFGALVENLNMGNVDSAITITVETGGMTKRNTHIHKQSMKPTNLEVVCLWAWYFTSTDERETVD